jgi:hypothetical protein
MFWFDFPYEMGFPIWFLFHDQRGPFFVIFFLLHRFASLFSYPPPVWVDAAFSSTLVLEHRAAMNIAAESAEIRGTDNFVFIFFL